MMNSTALAPLPAGPADSVAVSQCLVCGEAQLSYSFTHEEYPVYRCSRCGLLFLNPQPSDRVLAELRSKGDVPDPMTTEAARLVLKRLLEYLGSRRGRLLAMGCGAGAFHEVARAAGFEVVGAGGSPPFGDEVDALKAPAGPYDVCVLFGVVEQVRDPVHTLQRVRSLLKPDGVLFLSTPSLDSWAARMHKDRWSEFKTEHLCYFSSETIQNLLAKTGFHQVEIAASESPFQRLPFRRGRRTSSGMDVLCRPGQVRPRPLLSLLVPVYNEKRTFAQMMERLLAKTLDGLDREILLIESNSTDGTRDEVEKYRNVPGVKIVFEDRPRGKGHAVRTGLAHATGDFVLIQDADLEYDVNDYDHLLAPLCNHSKAFVLGSRHSGSWKIRHFSTQPLVSWVMNLGHWGFTLMLNLACGSSLKDPFTMYKVFRRDCLHRLRFHANRFDFDWELVIKLLRKGYQPLELPVNYESRSFGDGKKVSFLRDPLSWFWAVVRFRCERLYPRSKKLR